jgi:hypothetical protein
MLRGVRAYAAYVRRSDTPDRFVKLAATFFGPDRHWETDYGPSETKFSGQIYDETNQLTPEAAEYMRSIGALPL